MRPRTLSIRPDDDTSLACLPYPGFLAAAYLLAAWHLHSTLDSFFGVGFCPPIHPSPYQQSGCEKIFLCDPIFVGFS